MTITCPSPNGVDSYRARQAPDTVIVATLNGIERLERECTAMACWPEYSLAKPH